MFHVLWIILVAAAAAAKSLQSCPTLRPHRWQPTRLRHPWDSPGKNTGVGCHFLLQCMKVKSESQVPQSCLALHDPMDCSLPGSSAHVIFQARVLEWGAIAFSKLAPQQVVIWMVIFLFASLSLQELGKPDHLLGHSPAFQWYLNLTLVKVISGFITSLGTILQPYG